MRVHVFLSLFLLVVCIYCRPMVLDQESLNKKLFEILDKGSQSVSLSPDDKLLIGELIRSGANVQDRGRADDEKAVKYLFISNSKNLIAVLSPLPKWVGYCD